MNLDLLVVDTSACRNPPHALRSYECDAFVRETRARGSADKRLDAFGTEPGLFHEFTSGCFEERLLEIIRHETRRQLDDRAPCREAMLLDQEQLSLIGHGDDRHDTDAMVSLRELPAISFQEGEVVALVERPCDDRFGWHVACSPASRGQDRPSRALGYSNASDMTGQRTSQLKVDATCARLAPFGTTIFTTISARAQAAGAINLGQGFPQEDPPGPIMNAAIESFKAGYNQYAPMPGYLGLRHAIARDHAGRGGVRWDPEEEITVTSGATEALAATFLGLLEPDDEVVLFDPAYDAYAAGVALAGGRPVRVAPSAPDFRITRDILQSALSPNTRMIVINSPWNPTGRVLDEPELECVAAACREHDLLCVSDEVYERIVFEGTHRSIATLQGMRERTIALSSLGKTYSCTGWKIGWACASAALSRAIRAAHQFLVFSVPEPLQRAAEHALSHFKETWDEELLARYTRRRSLLLEGLRNAGFAPIPPQGTYFIMADFSSLTNVDDVAFCERLLKEVNVAAIPASVFTSEGAGCRQLLRFAFCKPDAELKEAMKRLARFSRCRET